MGQTVVEIWPISIFQDGGRPPSWIFDSTRFQLPVRFGQPICVTMPNVVPIGQPVAALQSAGPAALRTVRSAASIDVDVR